MNQSNKIGDSLARKVLVSPLDKDSNHRYAETYKDTISNIVERAWNHNINTIRQLGAIVGTSIKNGGILHVYGSGHSDLVAREIIGRAGGLACVTSVVDPTDGYIENLPGYGHKLMERHGREYGLGDRESIVIISNSGTNVAPIEAALYAKEYGMNVIVLTNHQYSSRAKSRREDGLRLYEVADYILDNYGIEGDAAIEISINANKNHPVRVGPVSGIIGASIMNWLVLSIIEWLNTHSVPIPVLKSQNLPGAILENRRTAKKYMYRLSRPLA